MRHGKGCLPPPPPDTPAQHLSGGAELAPWPDVLLSICRLAGKGWCPSCIGQLRIVLSLHEHLLPCLSFTTGT